LEDPNSVIINQNTTIYKGTTSVDTTTESEVLFIDLIPDTQYNVISTIQFDLNDGIGIQTKSIEKTLFTAPFLEIVKTDVINTGAVIKGEILTLQIDLNNPKLFCLRCEKYELHTYEH
jgi:hypothetical protein